MTVQVLFFFKKKLYDIVFRGMEDMALLVLPNGFRTVKLALEIKPCFVRHHYPAFLERARPFWVQIQYTSSYQVHIKMVCKVSC